MLKRAAILLGFGLTFLWMMGLGLPSTAGWLNWFIAISAVCSFAMAAFLPDFPSRSQRLIWPLAMAGGLLIIGGVSTYTGAQPWQRNWTFGFAVAFVIVAVLSYLDKKQPPLSMEHHERPRRSA